MPVCKKCGSRFNWVSVSTFFLNYLEPYIRCYQCFSDQKMKPSRRGVIGWAFLIFGFILSFLIALAIFNNITPEGSASGHKGGVFGVDRPIGETDTIRDTTYSLVRDAGELKIITLSFFGLLCMFMALLVFIPFMRVVDFFTLRNEQKEVD